MKAVFKKISHIPDEGQMVKSHKILRLYNVRFFMQLELSQ